MSDLFWLLPFLTLFTLLSVIVFALVSKKKTEERLHDPNAPKSTLATDGPGPGAIQRLEGRVPKLEDI